MGRLVELTGVSKVYPRAHGAGERLSALWRVFTRRHYAGGSTVLDGVSLNIERGQSTAVIGQNGAGKSTLLKLITGVLKPTRGSVETQGSMAALLELGAGFQPDFTGLENVRMKAALLGLGRTDLNGKLDEILQFADIGDYIHEPVKHYSSGMVVRLGFAVITAVRPDLLVTDEILAVGDESFQKKCIRWIEQYLGEGGTLLMVSHNMYQVQKLCQQACWIHDGQAKMQGDVFAVTQQYLAYHERKSARERRSGSNTPSAGIYRVKALNFHGRPQNTIPQLDQAEQLVAEAVLSSPDNSDDNAPPVVLFGIVRADGTPIYGISSDQAGVDAHSLGDGLYRYRIAFHDLPLLPGSYFLRAHAMDPPGIRLFDSKEKPFVVGGSSRELGFVRLKHDWNGG